MFDFTVITFLVFRLCMHMDDISILSISARMADSLFYFILLYYLLIWQPLFKFLIVFINLVTSIKF